MPEALSEQAAVGLREQRLRDLEARSVRVLPRVEPDVDALLHVAHRAGEEPCSGDEQREAGDHERRAAGRHVEHREERAEEHQRAAEVADEDEHEHRGAPDDQQRPEVLEPRDRDSEHAARCRDHRLAALVQIARQEDDDAELRELRRLEAQRPDVHAQVGAVHLRADPGQARKHQQADADRGDHVAVALEHPDVAQHEDREREQRDARHEPPGLLARERVVDAIDDHESDRGQQRAEREQVRIGVRQRRADEQVDREAQAEEDRAVGEARVADLRLARREHRREPGRDEQRDRDQSHQLPVASGHSLPLSSLRTMSAASSRERSWWSSTRRRCWADSARAGVELT